MSPAHHASDPSSDAGRSRTISSASEIASRASRRIGTSRWTTNMSATAAVTNVPTASAVIPRACGTSHRGDDDDAADDERPHVRRVEHDEEGEQPPGGDPVGHAGAVQHPRGERDPARPARGQEPRRDDARQRELDARRHVQARSERRVDDPDEHHVAGEGRDLARRRDRQPQRVAVLDVLEQPLELVVVRHEQRGHDRDDRAEDHQLDQPPVALSARNQESRCAIATLASSTTTIAAPATRTALRPVITRTR